MGLLRNSEKKPKGASTHGRNTVPSRFSLQEHHTKTPYVPHKRTPRESLNDPVNVRLPKGLRQDCNEIVQYTGRWSSLADFIRDAVRRYRNRWIDEVRRIKRELEESGNGET
jgi:Arc/MetJ-type ribon-helix-helix transcriptional regulator